MGSDHLINRSREENWPKSSVVTGKRSVDVVVDNVASPFH
jgi:hypothetical protein